MGRETVAGVTGQWRGGTRGASMAGSSGSVGNNILLSFNPFLQPDMPPGSTQICYSKMADSGESHKLLSSLSGSKNHLPYVSDSITSSKVVCSVCSVGMAACYNIVRNSTGL